MTREEAKPYIGELQMYAKSRGWDEEYLIACDIAMNALEQEPVLDRVKVEIEKAVWEDVVVSLDGTDEVRIPLLDPDDVFEIIDKYKAEVELQESEDKE